MTVTSVDDNDSTHGMNITGTEWEYHGNRIGKSYKQRQDVPLFGDNHGFIKG